MKTGIVGLIAAALVSFASMAQADPITVTGGFVGSDIVVTTVELITPSFSVELFGNGGFDGLPIIRIPGVQHVGQLSNFSATVNGPMRNVGSSRDVGTRDVINGVTYPNQGDLLALVNLRLDAVPVVNTGFEGYPNGSMANSTASVR